MKFRNKKTGEIAATYADRLYIAGNYYSSLAGLNEEWEDYEETKEFWFIEADGKIRRIDKNDSIIDSSIKRAKEIGNYFETEEEAEKAVEKLKAWKRLKDKRFQFHGHNALGFGEITFSLDFEDMDDEGEIGQLRHDLDLLFSQEDD